MGVLLSTNKPKGFYTYLHCKSDGTPFYIGKGKDDRLQLYNKRNQHHLNIVNKYGKDNILIGGIECSSEKTAFKLEEGIIKCLKSQGYVLSNMTDGGEGASGNTRSEEVKKAISLKLKGIKKPWLSKQLKEKQKNGGYTKGTKLSIETTRKMAKAKIGTSLSDETKQKIAASNKNKQVTICPHCGKSSVSKGVMLRWHFNNCKEANNV